MSAVTARVAVLRPTIHPERLGRKQERVAPGRFGAVVALGRRLRQAFARGVEPTSAALALTDPEQIRRLVPSDQLVDVTRWNLVATQQGGIRR